jgi:flagellar motor switch/type III secretory pathway protein FliN
MSIRAYKLINRSEGRALAGRLQVIAQSWAQRCATTAVAVEVVAHAGIDLLEPARASMWMIGKDAGGPALGLVLPTGWPQGLARWMLAGRPATTLDSAGSQLVSQMGTQLLQELGQDLYDAVHQAAVTSKPLQWITQQQSPLSGPRAGEPFVWCECQIGDDFPLHIVLWPTTVIHSLAPLAPATGLEPVAPLSRALERQPVRLDALAGEAEVAFQELVTLAPGDVLKLDRALSDPIEVRVSGGAAVCSARLGMFNGRLALQLT